MKFHYFKLIALPLLFVVTILNSQSYRGFKFTKFIDYIDAYYVDSVDVDALVEKAIVDILTDLDPHSTYIPADELRRMREPLEGNFEGIGVSFSILKDTIFIVSPITGGPSEAVGVMAGDKIIKVDDENVAGIDITNEGVFSRLRGAKGTKVTISVKRKNTKGLIDFTIIRDKIPIFSLDASYMINDNTGYIKISRFAATTTSEFKEAVKNLQKLHIENLVLDLTNNGGGYLDAAVNLADEFLPAKSTVVYTEGVHSLRKDYYATAYGNFEKGKIIVLIDEGSASASEILSGAIQDWDRGLIIGRRSFGKGLVQREMLLPDESAVRITTARYYTPSGRLIQKPFDEGNEKYSREIYDRYLHGEFTSKDSISLPDSLKYTTMIEKRIVYGGGGIMPDIFVPFDTSYYSEFYRSVSRQGIINRFVLEYIDLNRQWLKKTYPDFKSYNPGFKIDEKLFAEFTAYSKKEGVEPVINDISISRNQMNVMIKALIARDLFGTSEFYQIYNTTDETYLKALEVINTWDKYISDYL